MTHLLVTVRFLDGRYHGLFAAGGPPEWPPSPFRMYCALVSGLARRGELDGAASRALTWLQAQDPPLIIAPKAKTGQAITHYVPNNDSDKWPDRQDRLGTKPNMPTLFLLPPNQNPEVHYSWALQDTPDLPLQQLRAAARSLTALGWGIDLAFADARVVNGDDIRQIPGIRWYPMREESHEAGILLRVPTADAESQECTLTDLKHSYESTMKRIGSGEPLHSICEPRVFECVRYSNTKTMDPSPRPFAAFMLLQPDAEGKRAFNTQSRTKDVAGMLRHRVAAVAPMAGFSEDEIRTLIHGHANEPNTQLRGEEADRRFQFLPLPTINPKLNRVESIRRVLVVGPPGEERRVRELQRRLAGELLEHEGEPRAMLNVLERSDWVLRQYVEPSATWTSVTPVVLPGHHKGDLTVADRMLWKAFEHARLPKPVELDWRPVGFRAGVELASKYLRPTNMNGSMFHVRVRFPEKVTGPLSVGAGRYRGFGLLVRD